MHALTHVPSPQINQGLRTHVAASRIDYDLALRQHAAYCQLLRDCGARVHTLNIHPHMPDGVFLEDTAVVLDELAVLTTMGTVARRGELAGIETEVSKYRPVRRLELPAHFEGGDVLRLDRTLLVGLSQRTDRAGVHALTSIVDAYGYQVKPVPVRDCLHFKTACTALPDGSLLVNPAWLDLAALSDFKLVPVPNNEPWGTNVLSIGPCICAAAAHEQTCRMLERRGFDVRTVGLTEFAKAEGAVTCMSLLFS